MEIDVQAFRAKNPLRDVSFYGAVAVTVPLLVPAVVHAWQARHVNAGEAAAAVAPLTAWLTAHGYLRGKAAEALGTAKAAEVTANTAAAAQLVSDGARDDTVSRVVRGSSSPAAVAATVPPGNAPVPRPDGPGLDPAEPVDGEQVIDYSAEA